MDLLTALQRLRGTHSTGSSVLAGLLGLMLVASNVHAQTRIKDMSPRQRANLENMVAAELQKSIPKMQRDRGRLSGLTVKVKFDPSNETLFIDPGKGFLDPEDSLGNIKRMQELTHLAVNLLKVQKQLDFKAVEFRFEGSGIPL